MSTVAVNRKKIGEVETGLRAKRRARARSKALSYVIGRAVTFTFILGGAYLATNIYGHVLIDQARRDAADARQRLNTASRAVAGLERRVRELKSTAAIESWALSNGYQQRELLPGIDVPEGVTVVAQRD
jgi:cytochrome c-type biogenesis protein CcmH/NrfG